MRSANAAKEAIAFLKRTGSGRATFLPLDTVQRRGPNREEEALAKLPGILGYAVDLIGFKPEAENAVRFLLGRVLIDPQPAHARAPAPSAPPLCRS